MYSCLTKRYMYPAVFCISSFCLFLPSFFPFLPFFPTSIFCFIFLSFLTKKRPVHARIRKNVCVDQQNLKNLEREKRIEMIKKKCDPDITKGRKWGGDRRQDSRGRKGARLAAIPEEKLGPLVMLFTKRHIILRSHCL